MQRHLVQAVALFEAGRDIAHDVRALPAQEVRQQAGRRDAVDIIVAEDADLLPPVDRPAHTLRRLVHIEQRERVGQRLVCRQKIPCRVQLRISSAAHDRRRQRRKSRLRHRPHVGGAIGGNIPGSVLPRAQIHEQQQAGIYDCALTTATTTAALARLGRRSVHERPYAHGGVCACRLGAVFGTHMDLFLRTIPGGLYDSDGTVMVVSPGFRRQPQLLPADFNRLEVVTVVLRTEN